MRLFALGSSHVFGEKIAASLDQSLDALEERAFEDGEHKIRPLVSVRDEDVYVIHSLYGEEDQSVNDKLCKLLFFIATLRDAGANRITAIIPYLCYARKDRRTKARDPVTTRYVASLFEAVNVDRVVTVDVHNLQAFQNSYRCETVHLEAQKLFIAYFRHIIKSDERVVVMSPDIGSVKRAEQFRDRLSSALSAYVDFAFMEKLRSKEVVSGQAVVGDVAGKTVIILDDLISSGTTIARAATACNKMNAFRVYAVATHGAFLTKANEALQERSLLKIVITNTIQTSRLKETLAKEKLVVLDIAPFFAEVIRRLHNGGSLVSLLDIE